MAWRAYREMLEPFINSEVLVVRKEAREVARECVNEGANRRELVIGVVSLRRVNHMQAAGEGLEAVSCEDIPDERVPHCFRPVLPPVVVVIEAHEHHHAKEGSHFLLRGLLELDVVTRRQLDHLRCNVSEEGLADEPVENFEGGG